MSSAVEDQAWPPRLSLDPSSILELLTGDRFYSDKDAALREAVLNAIDACTRRHSSDADATPQITVEFDDVTRRVSVQDNGDGMDRHDLGMLFARIGASMSQLSASVEVVGEFGIGVISYFLICDSFEVHTCRGGAPIGLAFQSRMRDALTPAAEISPDAPEQGTTLHLNVRSQELYDLLLQRFSHWFRGVERRKSLARNIRRTRHRCSS